MKQVHPPDWVNPTPQELYDMVVLGAGTAGLVTAAAVAGLGGRAALVEEHLMGGDCLNFGCVPSKALLRCARAAADVRRAGDYGVRVDGNVEVDFGAVMERMRSIRAEIAPHDSAKRFSDELGVDVFLGRGRFTGDGAVEVDGQRLEYSRACIATGASASVPPVAGLETVSYRTSEELFGLTELPGRLGIVGAGAVGVEMAQAFARFGSEVVVVERKERILPFFDARGAEMVKRALEEDGVQFRVGAQLTGVENVDAGDGDPAIGLRLSTGVSVKVDELLVAVGRRPNVDDLGLDEAGVEADGVRGVVVDDRLRTTNSSIYAAGDVATALRFTHAADHMARTVVRNALFFGRRKFEDALIPRCVYTEPEFAAVGSSAEQLERRGVDVRAFTQPLSEVDRALVDGSTEGFVEIRADRKGRILGATVVGPHAGDLIGQIVAAAEGATDLGSLADVVYPYPTLGATIGRLGDAYNRTRLTPRVQKLLKIIMKWRR